MAEALRHDFGHFARIVMAFAGTGMTIGPRLRYTV
jgi:hypothetical protein